MLFLSEILHDAVKLNVILSRLTEKMKKEREIGLVNNRRAKNSRRFVLVAGA